ncbi:MAG: 16S rRNA (cytosine(1402)-N(4))-methyltransferase RsmH [Deltaproteobacteria bacterium]|nr:16S rRNA (cytosine(1402)-N(4))-methyltransferase RsmH [Deltaproteobacteria bacterium]
MIKLKEETGDPALLSLEEAKAEAKGEAKAGAEAGPENGPRPWEDLFGHQPVLREETLSALEVRPDGLYVDATLGGGGISRGILERLGPDGRLLALDLDPEPLEWAAEWGRGDPRLMLQRANFRDLKKILQKLSLGPADGLVADLGLSSRQFLTAGRGFSFKRSGPLDMRIDPDSSVTAADMVNGLDQVTLAKIIYEYGGDFHARRLARLIVERRGDKPFETTDELAALALRVGSGRGRHRLHPATRLFMALRMAVNHETRSLAGLLSDARGCLREGGRLLVISFQSEEDRLVKELFKGTEGGFKAIWKKSVTPSQEELGRNPRSRSARLRGGIALPVGEC